MHDQTFAIVCWLTDPRRFWLVWTFATQTVAKVQTNQKRRGSVVQHTMVNVSSCVSSDTCLHTSYEYARFILYEKFINKTANELEKALVAPPLGLRAWSPIPVAPLFTKLSNPRRPWQKAIERLVLVPWRPWMAFARAHNKRSCMNKHRGRCD